MIFFRMLFDFDFESLSVGFERFKCYQIVWNLMIFRTNRFHFNCVQVVELTTNVVWNKCNKSIDIFSSSHFRMNTIDSMKFYMINDISLCVILNYYILLWYADGMGNFMPSNVMMFTNKILEIPMHKAQIECTPCSLPYWERFTRIFLSFILFLHFTVEKLAGKWTTPRELWKYYIYS